MALKQSPRGKEKQTREGGARRDGIEKAAFGWSAGKRKVGLAVQCIFMALSSLAATTRPNVRGQYVVCVRTKQKETLAGGELAKIAQNRQKRTQIGQNLPEIGKNSPTKSQSGEK